MSSTISMGFSCDDAFSSKFSKVVANFPGVEFPALRIGE
jgi:hypothetical protein